VALQLQGRLRILRGVRSTVGIPGTGIIYTQTSIGSQHESDRQVAIPIGP